MGDRFGETSFNHFPISGAIGYRDINALRCFDIERRSGSPFHCVTTNDLRRQPHRMSSSKLEYSERVLSTPAGGSIQVC